MTILVRGQQAGGGLVSGENRAELLELRWKRVRVLGPRAMRLDLKMMAGLTGFTLTASRF